MLMEECSGGSVVRIELAIGMSVVVPELYQGFLTVRSLKNDLMRPKSFFRDPSYKNIPIRFYTKLSVFIGFTFCEMIQH